VRARNIRLVAPLPGASYSAGAVRRSVVTSLGPCLFLWVSVAGGCGGGATFSGGTYRDAEATYQVGRVPAGWETVDVAGQNDLAWSNRDLAAVIQVNASCDPDLDIPLEALRNHLVIGFTEREVREERRVPLDRREALRTHLVAKLDGVPREMVLTILKKDGCVYDFALVAPPGPRFGRALPDYDLLLGGFRTGGDR
jgi:hypothetical protein